ncbi:GST-like protein [Polaromonas sp. CG_9.11]|nr:GST-like protein [Polaromonas sp. CG_9.11]
MINVYSWPTPNGHKFHILLEECGFGLVGDWQVFPVNIGAGDQFKPERLAISPSNKIPALVDPDGPNGKPMALFESEAILLYLASKTGKLLTKSDRINFLVLQCLPLQMGKVGPCPVKPIIFANSRLKISITPSIATPAKPGACTASWTSHWPKTASWPATSTRSPTWPSLRGCAAGKTRESTGTIIRTMKPWCDLVGASPADTRGVEVHAKLRKPLRDH